MHKGHGTTTGMNEGRKHFDDVILEAGGFGRYQIIFISVITITRAMTGSHIMATVFGFDTPKFRCASPYTSEDTDYYNASLSPHDNSANSNNCQFHANRSVAQTLNGSKPWVRSRDHEKEKCSAWIYDTSDYTATMVSEFNLVCGRRILGSHAKMLFFAGYLIGSVIIGYVSDQLGRRTGLTLSVVLVASSGIGISFAPTYAVLVTMLFFNGMAVVGLFIVGFMLVMELTTPDKRVRPCMLYCIGDVIGAMCSVPLAYWLRSWRHLQLAISAPCFAFLLFAWWVPESGRWLLSKGRVIQAEKEVFKMARYNGVTLPSEFHLRDVLLDKKEQGNWRSVIGSRTLCKNIAIICLNWFTVGMTYYGITLISVYLSGDRFINTFAMSAVSLPGIAILYILLDRVGRTRVFCIVMILGGIAITASIIPIFVGGQNLQVMTTVLMIYGRFSMAMAFPMVDYMTTEMFPTYVRGIVIGCASTCARFAAMAAPYVNHLGTDDEYRQAIPPIVYGIFTTVSGLLTLCLPSTDKEHLPDSVKDGETLGQRKVNNTSGNAGVY